ANVAKLSPADVERIEVVRGPSSVVYGSQNMGGVINIILKNGRTAPGTLVEADVGSWLLFQGKAQNGGSTGKYDWYIGAEVGSRGDYNAGFRGSAANVYAFDNRYNQSADLTYNAKTPDNRGSLFFQAYYVRDVDDLTNPSPLSALNGFASRSWNDRNRRQLDIIGTRFHPGYKPWQGNELLLGMDWERSTIRSNRFRTTNGANNQVSPQDNNQTENVFGFYIEDAQRFIDDRLTVRGGLRQTYGSTAIDWTPFAATLLSG